MTKRERIEALEREVADLKARLAVIEARPYQHPSGSWVQVVPYTPPNLKAGPATIPCSDGTNSIPIPGMTWSYGSYGVKQ